VARSVTTRLDLPLLLPAVPDEADRCVGRLIEAVKDRAGVTQAQVVAGVADEPAKLCLHYDPDTIGLRRIEQLARRAGAELTDRFGHLLWQVGGISHQRRADALAARLERVDGVIEAEATPAGWLRVEFDRERTSEAALRAQVEALGLWVEEARPPRAARAPRGRARGRGRA
jgi:Zn2+/Cd2+-exporting ATPase